jgi:hypothetical protein
MASSNYSTAVFLGPSLPIQEAQQLLPADYYPPARMGDIYHLLGTGLKKILIIDGFFHGKPAIWHREILEAMREGIVVYGASSMGALRAAELEPFGMIGLGKIFHWYKTELIEGDDEVVLLHGDQESAYLAMTVPLVNVRETLECLRIEGTITRTDASLLLETIRSVCYSERTLQAIKSQIKCCGFNEQRKESIIDFFNDKLINLKARDAVEALKFLATEESLSQKRKPHWQLPPHDHYYACTRVFFRRISSPIGQHSKAENLIQSVCKDPTKIRTEWFRINTRIFTLLWAESLENPRFDEFVENYKKSHREALGISQINDWLKVNSMTKSEYLTAVRRAGMLIWIHSTCPSELGVDFSLHKRFYKGFMEWNNQSMKPLIKDDAGAMMQRLAQTCFHWHWANQRGIRHEQSVEKSIKDWETRCHIKDRSKWLTTLGISNAEYLQLQNERLTSEFLVDKGPQYFGINRYCVEEELLVELQMSGRLHQQSLGITTPD